MSKELNKYTKAELLDLIEDLEDEKQDALDLLEAKNLECARVLKELNALKAKTTGKVGFTAGAGRKNPLVD